MSPFVRRQYPIPPAEVRHPRPMAALNCRSRARRAALCLVDLRPWAATFLRPKFAIRAWCAALITSVLRIRGRG